MAKTPKLKKKGALCKPPSPHATLDPTQLPQLTQTLLSLSASSTLRTHSRAARRGAASDPTLNVDKSLLTCPLPAASSPPRPSRPFTSDPTRKSKTRTTTKTKNGTQTLKKSVLSAAPGSGISKPSTDKERRKESRKQRFRRERELRRAEMFNGKREVKVEKSLGKEVLGRERWVSFSFLFFLSFFLSVL